MTALSAAYLARVEARDAELGPSGARSAMSQAQADRRALLRENARLRAAIAAALPFVRACVPPDTADGWTACTHGHTWPCAETRAAWILRGRDPDTEYERAMKSARADLAYQTELEGTN